MMPELNASFLLRLLICYAIGSIPFAVVAMQGTGVDILKYGSGNPGFNNVLRYSKWRAVVTLLGDFGKGSLAILLAMRQGDMAPALWSYGLAAILGHCYSPWLKFNGGKGIATSAGVMLCLYPWYALPVLVFFAGIRVLGSKMNWREAGTIASLSAYALFVAVLFWKVEMTSALFGLVFLAFVTWRHRSNFQKMFGAQDPA
jgi:acyl phosphate:glycerol-3-phosphate acyltransferase